jgi:hypothetical protein
MRAVQEIFIRSSANAMKTTVVDIAGDPKS